jgi:hypothetical protein
VWVIDKPNTVLWIILHNSQKNPLKTIAFQIPHQLLFLPLP